MCQQQEEKNTNRQRKYNSTAKTQFKTCTILGTNIKILYSKLNVNANVLM